MVIGGGIIGVCTAFFLARKGVPVVLCEKGEIAAEQSSRNWGWCRKMGRDPLGAAAGDRGAAPVGGDERAWSAPRPASAAAASSICAAREQELAKREAWLEQVGQPIQLDSRLLTRDQIAGRAAGPRGAVVGRAFTPPATGERNRRTRHRRLRKRREQLGATMLTQCAVRGVETRGGRIAGVVTEHGRIGCESVVLAGGVWSRLFCRPLDLRLPQLKVLSSVMRTEPLAGGPEASASGFGFGLRKRLDGGYTVANWNGNVADIVPDSFRFFSDFLPACRTHRDAT